MRVDIQPQWRKLANWYWNSVEGKATHNGGMSIWEMLGQNYGAFKVFNINSLRKDSTMWVEFPDEKMYTLFLLEWA